MSEFRVGQRVRITQEGTVTVLPVFTSGGVLTIRVDDSSIRYAHTSEVEVLATPRPDEPTGLGAVVEACATHGYAPETWIRDHDGCWESRDMLTDWDSLVDPVVLHDGYRAH